MKAKNLKEPKQKFPPVRNTVAEERLREKRLAEMSAGVSANYIKAVEKQGQMNLLKIMQPIEE